MNLRITVLLLHILFILQYKYLTRFDNDLWIIQVSQFIILHNAGLLDQVSQWKHSKYRLFQWLWLRVVTYSICDISAFNTVHGYWTVQTSWYRNIWKGNVASTNSTSNFSKLFCFQSLFFVVTFSSVFKNSQLKSCSHCHFVVQVNQNAGCISVPMWHNRHSLLRSIPGSWNIYYCVYLTKYKKKLIYAHIPIRMKIAFAQQISV